MEALKHFTILKSKELKLDEISQGRYNIDLANHSKIQSPAKRST